jgi:hypothetical protein
MRSTDTIMVMVESNPWVEGRVKENQPLCNVSVEKESSRNREEVNLDVSGA